MAFVKLVAGLKHLSHRKYVGLTTIVNLVRVSLIIGFLSYNPNRTNGVYLTMAKVNVLNAINGQLSAK